MTGPAPGLRLKAAASLPEEDTVSVTDIPMVPAWPIPVGPHAGGSSQ